MDLSNRIIFIVSLISFFQSESYCESCFESISLYTSIYKWHEAFKILKLFTTFMQHVS